MLVEDNFPFHSMYEQCVGIRTRNHYAEKYLVIYYYVYLTYGKQVPTISVYCNHPFVCKSFQHTHVCSKIRLKWNGEFSAYAFEYYVNIWYINNCYKSFIISAAEN